MTTLEKQLEQKNKILKGLEKPYENLLRFKNQKNSVLVVQKNGKIQRIKPKELK
jgi:hypothetical protein